MTTIALAIPTCADWVPERAASLERLRGELGVNPWGAPITYDAAHVIAYGEFRDRAPNKVWSEQLWQWGYETGADYLLQLQDDVQASPRFWPQLRAMLEAVPDQVIGLEAAHPRGRQMAKAGVRWYTTADMLIGVGYVLPRAHLRQLLWWRAHQLIAGWSLDEDMLIALYCMTGGYRIWHPIPTIIDHDTSLASNYGHENHVCRRPSVTWKDVPAVTDWTPRAVPHLGRFYAHTPAMAMRWVVGFGKDEYMAAVRDVWRGEVVDRGA